MDVVLVGHCGPDAYLLKNAIKRAAPGANVVTVDDETTVMAHASNGSLLLVNRVLDGSFSTGSGIELIRAVATAYRGARAMLVSNHANAQAEAIEAGAMRGFGKKAVFAPATVDLIRRAVDSVADGTA